jgi:hypothetical protein
LRGDEAERRRAAKQGGTKRFVWDELETRVYVIARGGGGLPHGRSGTCWTVLTVLSSEKMGNNVAAGAVPAATA